MVKFKNKKTGRIVEEHLMFYVTKLRSNPNFAEIKENPKDESKLDDKEKDKSLS